MTARELGARAAAIRRKLSERDLAVLHSLGQLRLLTTHHVERLHVADGSPITRARRARSVLQRLHGLGLVVRLGSRTVGGFKSGSDSHLHGLSGLGQAVLGVPGTYGGRRRSPWETKPYFADHVLAVSELHVRLVETSRTSGAELLTFEAEPACWRHYAGTGGEPLTLKPDAYVRIGVGDIERSTFVEADLATESPNTIKRKCQAFINYWHSGTEQERHGVFPGVLWLVPTEHRRERLAEVVRHLAHEAQALFTVACFDDGTALLTAPEGGTT